MNFITDEILGIAWVYPRIGISLSYVNVLWVDNSAKSTVYTSFVMEYKWYAGFGVI